MKRKRYSIVVDSLGGKYTYTWDEPMLVGVIHRALDMWCAGDEEFASEYIEVNLKLDRYNSRKLLKKYAYETPYLTIEQVALQLKNELI